MLFRTPLTFSLEFRSVLTVLFLAFTTAAFAQTQGAPYARKNSFGILAEYSNDSSHILMGAAEKRKLLNVGVSYSRRLLLTHIVDWQYDGELFPVALEGDPLSREILQQSEPVPLTMVYDELPPISCAPIEFPYSYLGQNGVTYSGTSSTFCHGRQWTIGEAMSPIGMQWNFRPGRTIQPLFEGHGGYMYSTRPIPTFLAGSFNFTFDLGAGFEYFESHSRSFRVEYRYHHISNHNTARENPGIDNGVVHISYIFGR